MQFELPDIFSNLEKSVRNVLTIRIQPDWFAFSIYDPIIDGSFCYREMAYNKKLSLAANLKDIFFANEFLALPYKKMQVLVYSPRFTFVPTFLFEEKKKNSYLDFNFRKQEEKCLHQQLSKPELNMVFGMEGDSYEFLLRSLHQPQYLHHLSPMISFFQYRSRLGNTNKLFVNLQKDSTDIFYFSLGELVFANNFPGRDINDILYYIFFIWKQLKLDQLKDMIYVFGHSEQKQEVMNMLKEYLKNVVPFILVPEHHLAGVEMNSIPFDLLSLSLCEL